jgi:hypothetical protein
MDPRLPLECQDPKAEGFDRDQLWMVKNDAVDLVLLENAAELVRGVMMSGTNIESVLKMLSANAKGCSVLNSQTFPIWKATKPYNKKDLTGTEDEYVSLMEPLRDAANSLKRGNPKGCIAGVFAVEVEKVDKSKGMEAPGHYCALMYSIAKNRTMVFDSMQAGTDGSFYTPFFQRLAVDIFGGTTEIPECPFRTLSLQLTGGFGQHWPLALESVKPRSLASSADKKYKLSMQSTESQNHFCYMWSIWYIHHLMLDLDVTETETNR